MDLAFLRRSRATSSAPATRQTTRKGCATAAGAASGQPAEPPVDEQQLEEYEEQQQSQASPELPEGTPQLSNSASSILREAEVGRERGQDVADRNNSAAAGEQGADEEEEGGGSRSASCAEAEAEEAEAEEEEDNSTPCGETEKEDSMVSCGQTDEQQKQQQDQQDSKMRRRRALVIDEIVASEQQYVTFLQNAIHRWVEPIRQGRVLGPDKVQKVFSNIEAICSTHQEIAQHFLATRNVPQVLQKYSEHLKKYTLYVNNYDVCSQQLAEAKTSTRFQKQLMDIQESNQKIGDLMTLADYLIMPIQRLPRYRLLLEELKKNTPADHEEREQLDAALEKVIELASYINEKKREVDAVAYLKHLQGKLRKAPAEWQHLVHRGRELLFELYGMKRGNKRLVVYVFTDVLLLLSRNFRFLDGFRLDSVQMELVSSSNTERNSGTFPLHKKRVGNADRRGIVLQRTNGNKADSPTTLLFDRAEDFVASQDMLQLVLQHVAEKGTGRAREDSELLLSRHKTDDRAESAIHHQLLHLKHNNTAKKGLLPDVQADDSTDDETG